MKKFAAFAGFLALSATASFAADLPVKAVPVPVATPYSWTGFYVGVNGGYGWNDVSASSTPNDQTLFIATHPGINGGTPMTPASFNAAGGFAGGQVGYNWQFNPSWLLGFEKDFQWSNIKGTGNSSPFLLGGFGTPSNIQATQDIKWFGTVRARLGWLPASNWMVYATGGLAYARVDENVALNSTVFNNLVGPQVPPLGFTCVAGPNCFVGGTSRTATGWTAGGGLEYALTRNISIKAEYLYLSLGGGNSVIAVAKSPAPGFTGLSSLTTNYSNTHINLARVGLNWKF